MPSTRIALSLRQPWAWHILANGKDVENRSWRTNVRGLVLIHASRQFDGRPDCAAEAELPRGGIVGAVEIVDCVTHSDSDWWQGPIGFVLRSPLVLPFLPCRGKLGFFDPRLSDGDWAAIDRALGAAHG